MGTITHELAVDCSPEALASGLEGTVAGLVLLRSSLFDGTSARYSFLTAEPMFTFRSFGSRCEILSGSDTTIRFGNPWRMLEKLMSRFEMVDEPDCPFPLGGCFGYWGYDLKNFVEPKLARRAVADLELPECHVGFYDSLLVFDHFTGSKWIVATGLAPDGSRSGSRARAQLDRWHTLCTDRRNEAGIAASRRGTHPGRPLLLESTLSQDDFLARVDRAQAYIRAGDIYQVNLSHRLTTPLNVSPWHLFTNLTAVSPAPFSAYLDCGDFQVISSSPELFLRLSGSRIHTRPIKGTRPRGSDSTRDTQLSYELQTSPKETSELVMITDLLRNDLGRVCEFGSIHVPELFRLERYSHVQHLVSTVEGRLRPEVSHFEAFASCFPGGSVTGAPKIRAMEIIDELEAVSRGPYTGALGYLGFNRESQLSITIRSAVAKADRAWFSVGAGIVADSVPEMEYDETLDKARGFLRALNLPIQAPRHASTR
jgi:para-aminobenzoate synthetase component 1